MQLVFAYRTVFSCAGLCTGLRRSQGPRKTLCGLTREEAGTGKAKCSYLVFLLVVSTLTTSDNSELSIYERECCWVF